jgi:hypothetical protein
MPTLNRQPSHNLNNGCRFWLDSGVLPMEKIKAP